MARSNSTVPWSKWRLDPPTTAPADSAMLAHQSGLPRLPVPKLEDTLGKLRRSVKAVARTDDELDEFESKLDGFEKGQAGVLQDRLEKRAKEGEVPNWIAEWWDTAAYMAYRDSVVINVSYYYGFLRLPQGPGLSSSSYSDPPNPSYVASTIILSALHFRDQVSSGTLTAEEIGGKKLCMESYKWMFNSCRVPQQGADYAVKTREDEKGEAQTAVVIRGNRFWKLELEGEGGERGGLEELQKSIQFIYDNTPSSPAPGVGILTAANRDVWTNARTTLLESSNNASVLSTIEKAAFVLCLDSESPTSQPSGIVDFSKRLWHGTKESASNRWWDKALQWIIFDSGEAGFVGEHSCMDGTPTLRLNDWLAGRLLKGELPPTEQKGSKTKQPEELRFEVTEEVEKVIEQERKKHEEVIDGQKLVYLMYKKYGKEGIKGQKCSPDGWTQMVIQLAYYLTFTRSCGTYEAAQVRRFALGRTETVRTCTEASSAWTKAMVDPDVPLSKKKELFASALKSHTEDMRNASNANGIDRHLFGLRKCLKEGEEMPEVFSDELFTRSGTWNLSTSQLNTRNFPAYGWGYVVPDGFGIPYMIHPESLQFTVTSKKNMPAEKFVANLEKAADMVMDLMKGPTSPSKL